MLILVTLLLLVSALGKDIQLAGRLGTKTPYNDFVKTGVHEMPQTCFKEHCVANYMYKVVRHGTRFPTAKHLHKMIQLVNKLQHPEFTTDFVKHQADESLLCDVGIEELSTMGARTRKAFPRLFEDEYHPLRYEISSSQVTRALQSANAFAHGMFKDDPKLKSVAILSETKSYDRLLRFHKACPLYSSSVKKNMTLKHNGPIAELSEHIMSVVFRSIKQKASALNLNLNELAAKDVVPVVWDICMMEYSVFSKVSRFCSLLSSKDVSLLEYLDDVSTYWLKGYGYPINYEMSCLLFSDIIKSIARASSSKNPSHKLHATIRFAHAETMIPLLSRFGLFHDTPDNYDELEDLEKVRNWKTGMIVPFAANIAVVVYRCGDQQMIQILHNEHPIRLPDSICPGHSEEFMCPLDTFRLAVSHVVENCDFDKICANQNNLF